MKALAIFVLAAVACPPLLTGVGTKQVPNINFTFGQTYTYECLRGYESDMDLTVLCQADDTWTMNPLNCISRFYI